MKYDGLIIGQKACMCVKNGGMFIFLFLWKIKEWNLDLEKVSESRTTTFPWSANCRTTEIADTSRKWNRQRIL